MSTLSIIIPTRNRSQQVQRLLNELLVQKEGVASLEIIVVNDGGEPLGDVPPEVLVIQQDQAGPSAARNTGATRATGNHLIFLDDDCFPERTWLAEMSRHAQANPETVFAGRVVTEPDASVYTLVSEHIVTTCQDMLRDRKEFGFFLRPCNLCVPAKTFRRLDGFNQEFWVSEDREFSERCLQAGLTLEQIDKASVTHCKEYTLRSFWWTHFRYGQGAFHFHSWLRRRARDRFRLYHLGYYLRVFLFRPSFLPLLIVWQVANLAGFLHAWHAYR